MRVTPAAVVLCSVRESLTETATFALTQPAEPDQPGVPQAAGVGKAGVGSGVVALEVLSKLVPPISAPFTFA